MSGDISGVLIAGFSVVVLVLFIVQAIREAVPSLDSRYLPIASLVVATGLVALSNYAPPDITKTVATGIAIGAAASLSVRYVKNGDTGSGSDRATVPDALPVPAPTLAVEVVQPESVPKSKVATPLTFPPQVSDGVIREANPQVTVTMPFTK